MRHSLSITSLLLLSFLSYAGRSPATAAATAKSETNTAEEIFISSVNDALTQTRVARDVAYNLTLTNRRLAAAASAADSGGFPTGIDDCFELLDITVDHLSNVLGTSNYLDVRTWLSAALTNQLTCAESLTAPPTADATGGDKDAINDKVQSLMELISNSLALHNNVNKSSEHVGARKLLSGDLRYPKWVSSGDRKLLKASPETIQPHAVVAKDGSGTHRTIGEALEFVSRSFSGSAAATAADTDGGGGRTVIYVKSGTYKEIIRITTKQKNVMLIGDGKGKSVISGSRSAGGGWSTYNSATVGAMGSGFIAKGLTIINDAGAENYQAVALRVGADLSVVTECSIEGYQDTLYTHSNRQFYALNDISGTVDFIFGNSAAVFQSSNIQPRRPGFGQHNSITAQGRTDPNQNTGISIQGCKIVGSASTGGAPTYLGRPWQKYSRTVFMQTFIDGSVSPAGWEEWAGDFALSTLYYGEYENTGPGAVTSGRVRWPGVRPAMSAEEAVKFTVDEFVAGGEWLPNAGVDYKPGL